MDTNLNDALFLILSNLALLFAIGFSIKRQLLPETTILGILMSVSITYHFCQTGISCLFPLDTLREMDHFFVYSTLIWIVLYFIEPPWPIRISVFFLAQVFIFPFLLTFLETNWVAGVLIGVIVVGALFLLFIVVQRIPNIDWLDLLIAAILLGVGFALHITAGDPEGSNYSVPHSIWHILSMLAIYFVLEIKDGTNWLAKVTREFRGERRRLWPQWPATEY